MSEMSPDVAGHMAVILDANTEAIKQLLADRQALCHFHGQSVLHMLKMIAGDLKDPNKSYRIVKNARAMWLEDFVAMAANLDASNKRAWWHRMSNEDIAAELSATFDLGLELTRKIADWILTPVDGT